MARAGANSVLVWVATESPLDTGQCLPRDPVDTENERIWG